MIRPDIGYCQVFDGLLSLPLRDWTTLLAPCCLLPMMPSVHSGSSAPCWRTFTKRITLISTSLEPMLIKYAFLSCFDGCSLCLSIWWVLRIQVWFSALQSMDSVCVCSLCPGLFATSSTSFPWRLPWEFGILWCWKETKLEFALHWLWLLWERRCCCRLIIQAPSILLWSMHPSFYSWMCIGN